MKRIRVRIEEYEVSELFVEEPIQTVRLDLPIEGLEKIREVARGFDNRDFIEGLRKRIQKEVEFATLWTKKGFKPDLSQYSRSLLESLTQLERNG